MKEIQDEAAQEAALETDSDMRATAASAAALSAVGISQTDTVTE